MKHTHLRGSMTVELAIIFPVIFLVILGILSLCLVHYQNLVTASAAMEAAARGASYWDKLGGEGAWDFQSGSAGSESGRMVGTDYTDHDPYRYFFDTKNGRRIANTESFAKWLLGRSPDVTIGKAQVGDPKADKTGGFLQKYVTVTVTNRYTNPLGALFSRVGIGLPDTVEITASAPLNTPVEFIRNATFLYDQVHGTGK
jgi:hypothetical protein